MKSMICFAAVLLATLAVPLASRNHHRPDDDPLKAKRIELVDDQGRTRIELAMDKDSPTLRFLDADGNEKISIFDQADATAVYLKDDQGHTRVGLAQFGHGGGVAMHGQDGKGSAVYVLMNDRARLDVYDRDGKLRHRWPANDPVDDAPAVKKELLRHWIHSREEEKGDGILVYRPSGFRDFPPSRFRMQYVFGGGGKCQWMHLSPTDAHHLRGGKWQMDAKADNLIHVTQGNERISYEIVELNGDVLKIKRVAADQ